ncbi:TapY2 family type IVa secretion system protein [Shewanella sp. MEBiC00475]|uniref:TapY2 family type IVa secretion system protein n=1 Tax=Shewanella sp. MEBiC00475 TaxID=2575361 RepID=UPI0010C07C54|nr:TapY2 family type IVa secretion system protein [Shewanella sp. MEBiC00475]
MKITIMLISALSLCISLSALAVEEGTVLTPYKCHIETANGSNIALFVWDATLKVEEQSSLLSKYVSTITDEHLKVRRVVECITEDEEFKDVTMRELDEQRTY